MEKVNSKLSVRSLVVDTKSWLRRGGHRFDFFATDEDVQSWLNSGLLEGYEPYSLCGASRRLEGGIVEQDTFMIRPGDFWMHRKSNPSNWEYWIFSEKLTPVGGIRDQLKAIDRVASVNGLVLLQHGSYNRDKLDCSSLCVVDKLVHSGTLEEMEFEEYLKIFTRLKRVIKKDLKYSTRHVYPNGAVVEDERLLMTEKAAAAIEDGVRYINDVGRRLRE